MNLLIGSGNCKNIGDNAMISNIVNYLLEHTNWHFYIVDKRVPLCIETTPDRLDLAKTIDGLLSMPHWRIREYKSQPVVARQVCAVLFWSIMIFRAIALALDTKYYKKYKAHFFHNKSLRYWAELLNQMDGYWVVGGGNINDIWIEDSFWKMAFACIFRMMNKPVVFSGQGIGPLNRPISRLIVRCGIKYISVLSLREKISFELLKSLKINLSHCCITGDDALTINENKEEVIHTLPRNFVALNLRMSKYSFEKHNLIDKYTNLIKLLMRKFPENSFLFIPIAMNQGDSDITSAKAIIKKIGTGTDRISVLEKAISFENVKLIFENAIFSLGCSYHFCLFSLSKGIPTVGLYANDYYKQKLKGLMQMFGHSNGAVDLNSSTPEELIVKIEYSVSKFSKNQALMAKAQIEDSWNKFMLRAIKTISTHNYVN